MKLGQVAFITFYSLRYESAKNFFLTLGFSTISSSETSTVLTDGNLYSDLRRSDRSTTALSYISDDIGDRVKMAANLELNIVEQSQHHAVIHEPNGLNILLIDTALIPLKEFVPNPISICGTFYEISIETDDMERSIAWWHNVGFKTTTLKETWCTLDDGKIKIGLYKRGTCPHKFKNPSLTYFEPNMGTRIAELRKRGMTFAQDEKEIGMEGHAIVESPDGQYIFLFKS